MFMADFVLYFHLHYQVIPKIACMFSKPFEVRNNFNWSMNKYEQIWRKTSLLHYYRINILEKKNI